MGIGLLIRDANGSVVRGKWFCKLKVPTVREAECLGLREASLWCLDLQLANIQFESDSQQVINFVKNMREDASEFGLLVKDCILLCNSRFDFSFHYVKRLANGCAHTSAKAAIHYACPNEFTVPPLLLEECLSIDQ